MAAPSLDDFLNLPIRKKPSFYIAFWAIVAAFVAFAFWFGRRAQERSRYRRSDKPFAGQERLLPVLADIQKSAAEDGIEVTLKDLHPQFFQGREDARRKDAPRYDAVLDAKESERLKTLWRAELKKAKSAKSRAFARENLKWAHIRAHMGRIRAEGAAFQAEHPSVK